LVEFANWLLISVFIFAEGARLWRRKWGWPTSWIVVATAAGSAFGQDGSDVVKAELVDTARMALIENISAQASMALRNEDFMMLSMPKLAGTLVCTETIFP
jgi:hypothetical protein